ncbi:DNA-3-methyladenine glycosylase family protein [Halomarina rubra]|uniref:DNA-3-methyladenine glycosylase family protein n=1 Tax=Halomarina rubra TaxID=2071873 RepID=A0ABD6B066_9EURY|nr:DNA-3-methyladenine glycosylase 2 family protein [Halomarina rubra]
MSDQSESGATTGTETTPRAVLTDDPVMAQLWDEYGPVDLEAAVYDDEFERIVVSVVNQSVSTESANAVRERLWAVLDDEVTPDSIRGADDEALRDAGLSAGKVEYLHHIADAFDDRDYSRDGLSDHDDDAVVDLLTEIRGVGEWTARMYLLFALGREDVLPLGDLAVRRAIEDLYGAESRAEMRDIGAAWAPYRSYATVLLWRWYEDDDRAPLS